MNLDGFLAFAETLADEAAAPRKERQDITIAI